MSVKSDAVLKTGMIGSVITAICCFTPLLTILLGIAGLGAIGGYLDYILFPALLICLGLIAYGAALRKREQAACCSQEKMTQGGRS